MKKSLIILSVIADMLLISACSLAKKENNIYYDTSASAYNDASMWCYNENNDKDTDTFFINPTAASGTGNMDLTIEKNISKFTGAVKMEKAIYDTDTNFIAPYYHQALLGEYSKTSEEREASLSVAYADIKSAFEYYLMNMNNGHKIVLAGFSQGADMCLRLLSDYSDNDLFYSKYVACYAIGWTVSDDYLNSSSRITMAEGETDSRCIISYNCEDPSVTESFLVGKDEYTNAINPLSWKRNNEKADKSLNKGAVFYNTYGTVTSEVDNLTGCYIDEKRGTLKMTDINPDDYQSNLDITPSGVYHLYDYQFFHNNLKENVSKRVLAYK